MLSSTTNPKDLSGSRVCPRCHGFLIFDDMTDAGEAMGRNLGFGMRCINCGNVIDPLIFQRQCVQQC